MCQQCRKSASLVSLVCGASLLQHFVVILGESTCVSGHRISPMQPSPNMSSVTILVISSQKKKRIVGHIHPSSSLLSLCMRTQTQTRTHIHFRLFPSPTPYTHARKHTACFIIHLSTQHSVSETDSMDAKLPLPAGSVPLKHSGCTFLN